MKSVFDDSPIELTCPNCGHKFSERLGKLKNSPTLACPGCQTPITIDASQLDATVKQVDKKLADFGKALGRFGKKR